jgi:hypothetical protein
MSYILLQRKVLEEQDKRRERRFEEEIRNTKTFD